MLLKSFCFIYLSKINNNNKNNPYNLELGYYINDRWAFSQALHPLSTKTRVKMNLPLCYVSSRVNAPFSWFLMLFLSSEHFHLLAAHPVPDSLTPSVGGISCSPQMTASWGSRATIVSRMLRWRNLAVGQRSGKPPCGAIMQPRGNTLQDLEDSVWQ